MANMDVDMDTVPGTGGVPLVGEPTDGGKYNRYMFTCNNPPPTVMLANIWAPADMEYMCGQKEEGDEHTPHFHAYIVFKKRKLFTTALQWADRQFGHHTRVDICRGNEVQCKDYCTKPTGDYPKGNRTEHVTRLEGPWEFGLYDPTRGIQGHRTDLVRVADLVKAGATEKEVALQEPTTYMKFHSGIQNLIKVLRPLPPVRRTVHVAVLSGLTGVGKTHRVMTRFPEAYQVKPGRDPWGNYTDQKVIVFDEFDPTKWTIQDMNRYLDVWRCPLDARYQDKWAYWTAVVICSNTNPYAEWYTEEKSPALRDALMRRLETVVTVESRDQEIPLETLLGTEPSSALGAVAPQSATHTVSADSAAGTTNAPSANAVGTPTTSQTPMNLTIAPIPRTATVVDLYADDLDAPPRLRRCLASLRADMDTDAEHNH
jgi:hypothetical protein